MSAVEAQPNVGGPDALDALLPAVARGIPRVRLGAWPTPTEPLSFLPDTWVKREDLSSPHYGGNKVRCLEPTLARALDRGAGWVWGLGAYGSNQAVAIATHGPRVGLRARALLFPQPPSPTAAANLRALLASGCDVRLLSSVATFPWGMWRARRAGARAEPSERVIPPGAAVPLGAVGHLSAALEVADAVAAGALPPLHHVVLPVGSTCTTAGLLVGLAVAAELGVGFGETPAPHVHAVRVTPWPITSRLQILRLAMGTARLVATHGGPDVADPDALSARLTISGRELGWGYGRVTDAGRDAIERFDAGGGPHLDTTYSGKAGAYLLRARAALDGPTLFWSTKSAAPLAEGPPLEQVADRRARAWLARCDRVAAPS
ncbi:MAG: pyridoxal-phosphate dependent enzyme [Planctomycetota bacterium]